MANIGDVFRTGKMVPTSGVYRFVSSSDMNCDLATYEQELKLSRGEQFPPHQECKKAVLWELKTKA